MIKKISDAEYFAHPSLSNSDLNKFIQSPYAYWYYKHIGGFKKTPQMELGSLVHCLYLEPETFKDTYAVKPQGVDRRTKLGKQVMQEFESGVGDRTVVDQELVDKAQTVIDSVLKSYGRIEDIAGPGSPELAMFWELSGVECKGKADFISEDRWIWDLKTTSSLATFAKSVANFGYHRQAAFYGKGLATLSGQFKGFGFVVVETQEPFDCAVLTMEKASMRTGLEEILDALERLKKCREDNKWPSMYEFKQEIGLPGWYRS